MTIRNASTHVRRGVGALMAVLLLALIPLASPARADAGPGWSGDFTYAYADNPSPVLDEATVVRFGFSKPLVDVYVYVTDEDGKSITVCTSGSECLASANPEPGQTKTYTARLKVLLNGQWVERSTRSVSVTDPGWLGDFAYAYADNPSPVLGEATAVRFGFSKPLADVYVYVTDEDGKSITVCNRGSECLVTANPEPGQTKTYTARVKVLLDGQWVERSSRTVSVTDPGWLGDFAYAYADNPSPVLDEATAVRFGFSKPLADVYVYVTDENGKSITVCNSGSECLVTANPEPGQTKTYTARVKVLLNGQWVERSTRSVSVTDPGWTGTITPDASNPGFVQANIQAWFHFTASAPRDSATIKVYVDGVSQASCFANGETTCSVNFPVGANEVHVVRADVVPYLLGGTQEVRASATSVVTSMTPDQLADLMLSPAPGLGALGTPELMADLAALGTAADIAEVCFKAGVLYKDTKKLRGSPPDLTLVCDAAGLTARDFLATLVAALGVAVTVAVVEQVVHPASPDPAPQPQPDPIVPGGPNDPPATVVDTCQLPPGPDPEVFYFYQRTAQADDILASGLRAVGPQGKIWLASVLYASASEAIGPLALPDPPDGYFEVPRDRLEDLYGPSCVDPYFGQPGGGIEYWTTQPIDMGGLEWHPFP